MKLFLIVLICTVFFPDVMKGQPGCFSSLDSIVFGKGQGITSNDLGQYYITGYSGSGSYYNGLPVGNENGGAYLAKFDQGHNLLWMVNQEGGDYSSHSNAITLDHLGNPVIGGFYEQPIIFGDDTLGTESGSTQNAFVTKFQPDGTPIWSRRVHTAGVFSSGQIKSLSSDAQGNIYFGGVFGGTLIFGGDTIQTWGWGDNYWGKMDSLGNVLWVRAAGSPLIEKGVSVAADEIGNLYVAGHVNSSGGTSYVGDVMDHSNGFITKYSTTGEMQWLRGAEHGVFYLGKATRERQIDVRDGAVALTGMMQLDDSGLIEIAGAQALVAPGETHAFALKLDLDGNGLWLNAIATASYNCEGMAIGIKDNGDIAMVSKKGFLVGGDKVDAPSNIFFNINGDDGEVISYCFPEPPGTGGYGTRSLTTIGDTILATGSFNLEVNGLFSVFIAEISPIMVGVEENQAGKSNMLVYPNPNQGVFTIGFEEGQKVRVRQIKVYGLNGGELFSQKIGMGLSMAINIELPGLPPGFYILVVETDTGEIAEKLIVQ